MVQVKRKSLQDQIVETSSKPVEKKKPVEFISTGSVVLNLAASQKGRDGGWARGRINNLVGDGSTAKTILALEAAANAFYTIKQKKSLVYPEVKTVKIVYNNVEGVMDFPIEEMYGESFYKGVEWVQLGICQQFGRDVQKRLDLLKPGEFLLYICDSLDATISAEEKERINKSLKDDKNQDGSYKMEKAKYFSSSFFNDLCGRMQDKDATLMIISQVRENLNAGMFGKKFYRTGGKAMDFYTHIVPWLYVQEKLEKTRNNKKKTYGIVIKAKFDRNKVAKPFREASFRVLFDYGIDDVNTMIDYLYGHGEAITIRWEEEEYKRGDFVNMIDENPDQYNLLAEKVENDWAEFEDSISPKRKKRYE